MFSFNFAPQGWALCNGQLLSIQQNQALFAILGTTFGGNGTTSFALPNMQSRAPVHWNPNISLGEIAGTETVTLLTSEMPSHQHSLVGTTTAGDRLEPSGYTLANVSNAYNHYAVAGGLQALNPTAISSVGGQPHTNIQPYLAVNFSLALSGIFPSRN
jgi:microcystin-dependent protein